ncbi:HpcH/HpaI aldolase family protein [Tepidamorphus sp. 3E244]|uniref:HpcH/HpaI aldolase family protein n=1 Tax=Tepidamorphus sp. 3E244 TaxID=3385498 RepID=UPI0038FBEB5F
MSAKASPTLASRLAAGEFILSGWAQLSDPLSIEAIARAGFSAICMDCQHGYAGYEATKANVLACAAGGAAPIVRMPHGDFAFAARALDLGAEAVIAPMINSVADAKRFVEAVKYPPLGERSWGPARMMHVWGTDANTWVGQGNSTQLALAMCETREALEAADDIVAIEGIDGLFIGPADMSMSMSAGSSMNPEDDSVLDAIKAVAKACKAHGKLATGYAQTPKLADAYREAGFALVCCGSDYGFIRAGAAGALKSFGG